MSDLHALVAALPKPQRLLNLRWTERTSLEGGEVLWVEFRDRFITTTFHFFTHGDDAGQALSFRSIGPRDGDELRYLASIADLFKPEKAHG